jgi:hypothetical protein
MLRIPRLRGADNPGELFPQRNMIDVPQTENYDLGAKERRREQADRP